MLTTALPDVAQHYRRMQIQTASHAKSICMLHERCMHLIGRAGGRGAERRPLLDKAQNILAQLQSSLRMDDRTSQSLFLLYDYCYVLLERGEKEERDNAQEILTVLKNSFNRLYRTL
jgi:flagellin-specific chaperone FliS